MSIIKYSNKSIWKGNQEREDVLCPICQNIVATFFTNLNPEVYVIQRGNISNQLL